MAKVDERQGILERALDRTEGIALEHFDHIRRVNDVFYDQVKLSDQKAAYIFTFMLATFPAGLVIYWAWNNTLSIIQQGIIMRRHGVKIELFDNLKGLFAKKPKPSS